MIGIKRGADNLKTKILSPFPRISKHLQNILKRFRLIFSHISKHFPPFLSQFQSFPYISKAFLKISTI